MLYIKPERLAELRRLGTALRDVEAVVSSADHQSVNRVAEKAFTQSRRAIVDEVNLTATYVRARMQFDKASQGKATAIIRARQRPTRLATFDARQVTRPVPAAKGDPRRGIPAGQAQAGVTVKVKRTGSRKAMRGAFLVPLRAGTEAAGNGMGVFIRPKGLKGRKDIVHLYGVSVDQVFRGVSEEIRPGLAVELEAEIVRAYEYKIRKALNLAARRAGR